jgi:hypothetical protein
MGFSPLKKKKKLTNSRTDDERKSGPVHDATALVVVVVYFESNHLRGYEIGLLIGFLLNRLIL